MTRRPPCSRFCPFIRACQECDWQSLTPAPFIAGVSAGGAACRDTEVAADRETLDDVSDPRERRNSGGLAGNLSGGPDVTTIPIPVPPRAALSGGVA